MNLEEIKNPDFLKELSYPQLESLCQEIRSFLIEHVAVGGHLASNLGIVELTVALHRTFDMKKDKLVFDVGHQCYTHKILTGRGDRFATLRALGGLSGFQSRTESSFDCYEGGHCATSISAALGFAMARDHLHQDHSVIAVIGDDAIGNGMAYEALNHISEYKKPLIIILNDNKMGSGSNIGAIHDMLEHVRLNAPYYKAKSFTKHALKQVPLYGDKLIDQLSDTKRRLKGFYFHGKYIFAQLGINYYGPIDGHNLEELEKALLLAKSEDKPVLIHVLTEKGKGYQESAKLPAAKQEERTVFSKVLSDALITLAAKDEKILAVTPAVTNAVQLLDFKEKYPERFIDTGIAQEHALVLANALAVGGMHPYLTIYSTYLQRGYDQLLHDIARMQERVVLAVDGAGIIGEDGAPHQGLYDVSFMLPMPNLIIAQPRNVAEATRLLATAFAQEKPFVLRHSRNLQVPMAENLEPLPIGSWEVLSEGPDGVIISYGDLLTECEKAQGIAKEQGYELGLINARFLKPIDVELFKKLLWHKLPIFVCEEAVETGSLGSYLLAAANNLSAYAEIHCFGVPCEFISHGKREEILEMLGLDGQSLAEKICGCM